MGRHSRGHQSLRKAEVVSAIREGCELPAKVSYKSILGFLPLNRVPGLQYAVAKQLGLAKDDVAFDFFETKRTQQGFFSVEHLTPNQLLSVRPFI